MLPPELTFEARFQSFLESPDWLMVRAVCREPSATCDKWKIGNCGGTWMQILWITMSACWPLSHTYPWLVITVVVQTCMYSNRIAFIWLAVTKEVSNLHCYTANHTTKTHNDWSVADWWRPKRCQMCGVWSHSFQQYYLRTWRVFVCSSLLPPAWLISSRALNTSGLGNPRGIFLKLGPCSSVCTLCCRQYSYQVESWLGRLNWG